ncbi:hypothetical protein BVRB_024170 [Beta vulgaris subsp. vulgaris]|uniref:Gem-associated protein 2 n=1 Tax=Beta vulgaris subsp. vulgaris TaxID=3555 RepID=A0A0J8B2S5_BETVV|nr:hypothetical protein BVRB_024170 [Beta vulgaris subsp. vulgaris]
MTDQALLPNPAWANEFIKQFIRLRSTLSELSERIPLPVPTEQRTPLPHPNNVKAWCQRMMDENQLPILAEIVRIDQVNTRAALKHLVELVRADNEKDLLTSVMVWLWALLMRLDALLLPDTAAVLRNLFRALATRRSMMDADDDMLGAVNIALTIIHRVFGQSIPMNDNR